MHDWCLKESVMKNLWTVRTMVSAMHGAKLKDRIAVMDLMLMLGLSEAIDLLGKVNTVSWYGHVLRRERMVMS